MNEQEIRKRLAGYHGSQSIFETELLKLLDEKNAQIAARESAPAVQATEPEDPMGLSAQLREYANNPGYSHGDYADTMTQAANAIDRLTAPPRYAAMECETLGDPAKRTGVYAPPAQPTAQASTMTKERILAIRDEQLAKAGFESNEVWLINFARAIMRACTDAAEVAQASAEPVAILFPDSDSPFGYSMMAKDSHPHVIWLVDGFNVYTAPAASAAPVDRNAEDAEFDAYMDEPCVPDSKVSRRAMYRNGGSVSLLRQGWMLRATLGMTGSAAPVVQEDKRDAERFKVFVDAILSDLEDIPQTPAGQCLKDALSQNPTLKTLEDVRIVIDAAIAAAHRQGWRRASDEYFALHPAGAIGQGGKTSGMTIKYSRT
jgi:hypothetical protein